MERVGKPHKHQWKKVIPAQKEETGPISIYKHWRSHILTPMDNDQKHFHKPVDAPGTRGQPVHMLMTVEPRGATLR